MKKYLILLLVVFSLGLLACSSDGLPVEEEDAAVDGEEEAYINLASEAQDYFPLRASFMSDNRSMVYTFDYDGNLLKMVDSRFDGSSEYGANFKVEGGAEITTVTFLKEDFVAPSTRADGICKLLFESVEHEEEVLVMRLRVCPEDDAELAEEALQSLVDGLMLEWL